VGVEIYPHRVNQKTKIKNMSCLITEGYAIACKGIAGVQAVFIGEWNGNDIGYTIGTGLTAGQIEAFTGATVSFYEFQQTIETGSLTEAGNFNVQNGTAFYEQTVEITVHNTTATLIEQVNVLGRGRWRILVLDVNGSYFLVGKQNPVQVSAVAGGLGKAYGDLNGFTITFTGKEYDALTQVTTTAALSVIQSV
jgi:hypothetical protein